jgi:hypothetical protein
MNRKPTTLPGQTWEFFSACIYYLGKAALTSLFQRSERQVERWAADPAFAGGQRNPVDRYEVLLQSLMDKGHGDVARAMVARQAHIAGCALKEKSLPLPDKATVELEIIDDLKAKVTYDTILLDPSSSQEACRIALEAYIREIQENYVKKCQEKGWTA